MSEIAKIVSWATATCVNPPPTPNLGVSAMRKPTEREIAAMTVNPNPRLVALMNYAISEVSSRLHHKQEYREWLDWAATWKDGQRSPQACVEISHRCGVGERKGSLVWPTLGQLAWGAKEACYTTPTSGWLVIRYIADAMCAFGVAFPYDAAALLEPPGKVGNKVADEENNNLTTVK